LDIGGQETVSQADNGAKQSYHQTFSWHIRPKSGNFPQSDNEVFYMYHCNGSSFIYPLKKYACYCYLHCMFTSFALFPYLICVCVCKMCLSSAIACTKLFACVNYHTWSILFMTWLGIHFITWEYAFCNSKIKRNILKSQRITKLKGSAEKNYLVGRAFDF